MPAVSRAFVLASAVPLVTCASLSFIRDHGQWVDEIPNAPAWGLGDRIKKEAALRRAEKWQKWSHHHWAGQYKQNSAIITEWARKHMYRSTTNANLYRYVPFRCSTCPTRERQVTHLCKAMKKYHEHAVPLRQNLVATCDNTYTEDSPAFAMLSGAGEKTLSEFMQDWRAMGKPTRLLWLYIQQLVEAHDIIYKSDLSVTKDQMITMNLRKGPTIMQISEPKGHSAVTCSEAMADLSDQLLAGVCGVDTKAKKEVEYLPKCLEGNRDKEHKGRLQSLVKFLAVDMKKGGCARQMRSNLLERKKWVLESLDVKKRLEDFDATKEGFDLPL